MDDKNEWYAKLLLRCTRSSLPPVMPFSMTRLTEHVYLGSADDAYSVMQGESGLNIKCLINMTTSKYQAPKGITVYHVPLKDDSVTDISPIIPPLMKLLDRLEAEKKPTLIHCVAGINRSGAAAMAYVMHKRATEHPRMTPAERFVFFLKTYYMLRDLRGAFLENQNFRYQLIKMFVVES
ncbi:protein phosphatase-like protein [Seal parapoxvirus]|uniref:Protein phosphatase-like protein n=1 Tax=Seal parapoxvirus TaxID=187984 RepID=A0A1Z3GCU7_9POXV|nr:protein phosphatase-like protein [Seal parapoxvirus]ASC55583.1 protein phosphatase-like protein [Seal parapoxvirus]